MSVLEDAKTLCKKHHYFDAFLLLRESATPSYEEEVSWLELSIDCLLALEIPEQTESLFKRLGERLLRDQKLAAAEACLQRAQKVLKQSGAIRMQAGSFYVHTQNWSAAERCFRAALQLDAYRCDAWHQLADVLLEISRVDEAFLALLQASKIDPANDAVKRSLSRCKEMRGQQ